MNTFGITKEESGGLPGQVPPPDSPIKRPIRVLSQHKDGSPGPNTDTGDKLPKK